MIAKIKKAKKSFKQNVFFSVLLGLLIFLVVGFLIVSNFKLNQRRVELNEQLRVLQETAAALEAKSSKLQSQISETVGQDYLEREARETFNLKKPGEEVVAILSPEGEEGEEEDRNFFQKIWDKIKIDF